MVLGALTIMLASACGGSPAGVVQQAAAAAEDGDLDTYVACFTERSRPLLRAYYATAERTRPELARLGARGVVVSEVRPMPRSLDGTLRATVTVVEDRRSIPLVLHSVAGAWRIDLMDSERALTSVGMGL